MTWAHPSRPAWVEQRANALEKLADFTQAAKVRRGESLRRQIASIPADAPPSQKIWPLVADLVLSPPNDSAELHATVERLRGIAKSTSSDPNAVYGQALLEFVAGDPASVSSLTKAAKLLPSDFGNVYYWRARARAAAGDLEGCLDDCERASSVEALRGMVLHLQGYAHYRLGRFKDARDGFELAVAAEPSWPETHQGLVLARVRLGEWRQAVADSDRASRQGLSDTMILAARGEAELNLGLLEEALADCLEALTLSPKNAYAYRVRGVTHYRRHEWNDAVVDLTQAIGIEGDHAVTYAYRADAHRLLGNVPNAAEDADAAVARAGNLTFVRLVRVLVTLAWWSVEKKADLLDSAERDGAWMISIDPADASGYWAQSLVKQARGKIDEALVLVKEALTRAPRFASAYQTEGSLRMVLMAWSDAADSFQRAIEYGQPADLGEAYFGLAECERMRHEYGRAINAYAQAIRHAPNLVTRVWSVRAWAYFEIGLDADALKDFESLAAAETNQLPALLNWAFVLVMSGRSADGVRKYSEAVARDPKSDEAYASRGWARGVDGDLEGAVSDESRAIELNPKVATHFNNRAWAFCKLQRWSEAVGDCDRAVALDSSLDYAFKNRSLAYWSLGRFDDALADLNELMRIRRRNNTAPASARDDVFNWRDQANDWGRGLARREPDAAGHLGYGMALWMSGQPDRAEEQISRAVAMNAELQIALEILDVIRAERGRQST